MQVSLSNKCCLIFFLSISPSSLLPLGVSSEQNRAANARRQARTRTASSTAPCSLPPYTLGLRVLCTIDIAAPPAAARCRDPAAARR